MLSHGPRNHSADLYLHTENEQFPPGYAPPAKVVNSTNLRDLSGRISASLAAQGINSTVGRKMRRSGHGIW